MRSVRPYRTEGTPLQTSTATAAAGPDTPSDGRSRAVAVEQSVLDACYARLDRLREQATDELARVRRQSGGSTPQARLDQEALEVWHEQRIAHLAVEARLCIGRLDLDPDLLDPDQPESGTGSGAGSPAVPRRHIGRIGLSDEDGVPLLLDWRAPASAAFYQATAAAPHGVLRRRHLTTRDRRVTAVSDEILDTERHARLVGEHPELAAVDGDGALLSALTARRTGRMGDIVATIQAEQDAIIRAPREGVLVVQGGPGTGKTAVALHRAAYLLYTHREQLSRSGVLVVGPSTRFLRYIEQVLPSLGETGVALVGVDGLVPGVRAETVDPEPVAALKGDLRMVQVLAQALRRRQRIPAGTLRLRLDGDAVGIWPGLVRRAQERARAEETHNEGREAFVRTVLDDLANQLARARGLDRRDPADRADLVAELRHDPAVRREVNLLWMPLTAQRVLRRLLEDPAELAACAEGVLTPAEQRLLHRRGQAWSAADVALLDELWESIGPPPPGRDGGDADRARERAHALQQAEESLAAGGMHPDGPVSAQALADRMLGTAHARVSRPVAERAVEDRTWAYGHVVVDEAQELSPMQWRMLLRRIPTRSMTVVGDIAQTGSTAGARSWESALGAHVGRRWRVVELTVSYRTPGRVMRYATAVARSLGVPVGDMRTAREGDGDAVEVHLDGAGPRELARRAGEALASMDAQLPGARLAVICAERDVAAVRRAAADLPWPDGDPSSEDARIAVLSVSQAKGLEFDGVVVAGARSIAAAGPQGGHDLYVALTRCTQRLTVIDPVPVAEPAATS